MQSLINFSVNIDHVNDIPMFNNLGVGDEITVRLLVTGVQLETSESMTESGNVVTIPGRKSLTLSLMEVVL